MKFFTRRHLLSPLLLVFIWLITFCNTSHHIRHYRERFKRQQGAHLYLTGSNVTDADDDNRPDSGPWSDWSSPSQCSRTCGGGVSTQYRQCADGYYCTGPSKTHFSCNTQDCPDAEDFRAQQCSEYDHIPFDGVTYKWVPYTKAPNPCELNCMPRGERFYYRHKQKVIDGTRCSDEKLDVCVDGKCQPVGCDMMLGSDAREDKCRKCRGDGSACNTITGTLDMKDLQVGYNDVLLIPAGATNIRVNEKDNSNNYLAVRNTTGHYYLNGNWKIDFPSVIPFAGCNFHYERYPQGFAAPDQLYCLGPIDEPLFIVLLYQDVNVGVDYEYSIPKNVEAGTEVTGYAWTFDEYTPCSASCGGGVQYRNVTCAGRETLEPSDRQLCIQSNEPPSQQRCNDVPCPPLWVAKPWEKCSAPCGSEGVQKRQVVCEQVITNGYASIVENDLCSNVPRPPDQQACNQGRECGSWHTAPWKPCDHLCGDGKQKRDVTCYRKDKGKIETLDDADCTSEPKPENEKACNVRPCEGLDWVTSEWSGCEKCGLTNESRRVQCATLKGKVYPDELCKRTKPEDVRECKTTSDSKCENEWWASQWSDCSAKCGNGVQTRKVFCTTTSEDGTIKKVEDDKCDGSKKYESMMNCTGEQETCAGEWFTGPWKDCSKKCGGGEKSRKVICLKDDVAVAAAECGPDALPSSSEVCNEQPCSKDEILPVDITQSVDESEPTEASESTEPSASSDSQDAYSSTVIPTDDATETTESGAGDDDDEDVEYEIVEADTCEDGEWVEAEDVTDSSTDDDLAETTPTSSKEKPQKDMSFESLYIMQGDEPAVGPTTESEGSGDTDSTYSTDSTISTVEGSGDDYSTTDIDSSDTTPLPDLDESLAGLKTKGTTTTVKSTGTTEDYTGPTESTESTTEFTGSTESTPEPETTEKFTGTTESTTKFTGTTEAKATKATTEFTGSTETTTEFTGSTESTEAPESTTEFTGTTEEKVTETTTKFTGSTESTPEPETTTEFTGTTEEKVTETTTEFTGSTGEEVTVTTTEFTGSTESTESPGPTESTTEFTGSTESTEAPASTTEFTGSTESTTEFTGSTESTTEFTGSTESTTEFTGSTESTTEFTGSTESTTEFTGSTETTEYDIWSSTTTEIMEIFTTRPMMCKRKKRKDCKKSKYGCCPDKITPAKGPFDKDCPMPKTCKESEFGCCEDGVSQALGKGFQGCPKSDCDQSLFGCCPDKKTAAKGNNKEGCPPPPPKCLKTKFGCCKDNVTAAKGPKQKGCEPDVKTTQPPKLDAAGKTCATSDYGCCPDGKSAAEGPNYKGCKLECAKTAYGCCQDAHTPAHGYNREGCCLQTPFGCCPDNIKPAQGPNLEGCGCQYSAYKCCPDNVTPARGYNKEGCGCQFSEHGCCPDKTTPAPGANYEGCPCHTFQFGCCSDGVTVSTGPGQQGCGCRYSEHGCCSDEKTPASGPNNHGCSCADTKFGCCYDGVTEAQGENFAGCEDVPANMQESCSLPRESGECKNYTIKWYYDAEYGACSRFWFGGCGGNGNRFKDKAECDSVCVNPPGKDRCKLGKVSGPCNGYYPKWHYDKDKNHCAQFIWNGCLGNNNQFETSKECEDACVKGSTGNVCSQPKEEGPCSGAYDRWYFDETSDQCERFTYGGCEGNGNNFRTEAECKHSCKAPGKQKDQCSLPKSEGNCTEKLARWYHDASAARCMPFYYTGCGSNNNNYESVEECERNCPPRVELDTCDYPAETGECANYENRWYYDTKDRACRQFYYGGCGGNGNNFRSEPECMGKCRQQAPIPTPPTPPPVRPEVPYPTNVCDLPSETGNCANYTSRFFFDRNTRRCEHFYYGGCNGNGNNFESVEECERQCIGKPPAVVTEAPAPASNATGENKCQLPYDVGHCYNYVERYYYDHEHKYCRQFYYGSCGGNGNNFVTQEECEEACQPRSPEPQVPQSDVCQLILHPKPCDEHPERWYYDYRSDECAELTFEGCLTPGNRFADKEACERRCKRSSGQPAQVTEAPHDLALCYLPAESGNCSESIPSYHFSPQERRCVAFIYTGCGGNANRYNTEEQCERQCGRFREQDVCNLPQETGPCRGNFMKVYYDAAYRRCLPFRYGGCEGNANRFSSIEECEGVCIKRQESKPNIPSTEICKLPLDIGACSEKYESHKRWYFNDERGECTAFIYTGCGGNFNQFKSYHECVNTCKDFMAYNPDNDVEAVPLEPGVHPCQKYVDDCQRMYCEFGIESYVDNEECHRCKCHNPCENQVCPSGTVCATNLNVNKTSDDEPNYVAICRLINKPGECPELSVVSENCEDECRTDADCTLDLKCCQSGCNYCAIPISHPPPGELITPSYLPAYTEKPVEYLPPVVDETNFKPFVRGNEGDYVTLSCSVSGNTSPNITWRKDDLLIDGTQARYRLLLDGALQIITLHKTDSGIYLCTADNKVQNKIELEVTDSEPFPASIIDGDERETNVVASLGSPTSLNCYAIGYPFPAVTWFKDKTLIPLKTTEYEVRKDYSLLINKVNLPNLGIYTCQAYNGFGKAASWSVTVQALGPVHNFDPEDAKYLEYVINKPENPQENRVPPPAPNSTLTHRPQPPPPQYNLTREPVEPQEVEVPVWANIPLPNKRHRVGTNISIPCIVTGSPQPRVTWYYEDHPLFSSDKHKISTGDNYTLTITNADLYDAGTYRCEARNHYQDYSDQVTIEVEGVTIPADCKDNQFFANCALIVKGNYCSHVYYAKFCCRSCMEAGLLQPNTSPKVDERISALEHNLVRRK